MAEDQIQWPEWPPGYPPPGLNQNYQRIEQTSLSDFRRPSYYSTSQPQSNRTQTQSYPELSQNELFVRPEDVMQNPIYRFPTSHYRGQTIPASNLKAPTNVSNNQPAFNTLSQTPKSAAQQNSRQSRMTSNLDSFRNAKRRRVESPATTATPQTPTAPKDDLGTTIKPLSQASSQPSQQSIKPQKQQVQYPIQQQQPTSRSLPSTALPNPYQSPAIQPSCSTSESTPQPLLQVPPKLSPPSAPKSITRPSSQPSYHAHSTGQYTQPQPSTQPPMRSLPQPTRQGAVRQPSQSSKLSSQPVQQSTQRSTPQPPPRFLPQPTPPTTSQATSQPPWLQPSDRSTQQPAQWPKQQSTSQIEPRSVSPAGKGSHNKPLSQSTQQPTQQSVLEQQKQSTQNSLPRFSPQISNQPASPQKQQPISQAASNIINQPISQLSVLPSHHAPSRTFPPSAPNIMPEPLQIQPKATRIGRFDDYSFKPKNDKEKTFLKHRADIAQVLKEEDAADKITYDPNTIARDVLIASGRHPTQPALNHHLFRLRDVFTHVDVSTDLTTFRWDLVDPLPSRDRIHKVPAIPEGDAPPSMPVASSPVNNTTQQFRPPQYLHSPNIPTQRAPYQSAATNSSPAPAPPPQPPESKSQSQLQRQAQLEVQVEKPGTPQKQMTGRRPGRPPGSTNKPKAAVVPLPPPSQPSYSVFTCKWGNCQAELHNLEMLKKHIFKNHVSYQITCGWKSCSSTGNLPAVELYKHVKKEHLNPIAWELGDGPSVPTTVDQVASDTTITIPESNQPGSEASLIFPASYSSVRAFNRVHGNVTQYDRARGVLKAVQRLKGQIGVGLDPGGCELATPARNERVSNDEDIYEVQIEP